MVAGTCNAAVRILQPTSRSKRRGPRSTAGRVGEILALCARGVQQGGVQSGGGPHPRPVRGRCVTHTFINLADSYTPTVRRSWHCAATSSSSTAALTVCILGSGEKDGQRSARPAGHRSIGTPPGLADLSGPQPGLLTSAPRCRTPRALPKSCCSYNPQWKAAQTVPTEKMHDPRPQSPKPSHGARALVQDLRKAAKSSPKEGGEKGKILSESNPHRREQTDRVHGSSDVSPRPPARTFIDSSQRRGLGGASAPPIGEPTKARERPTVVGRRGQGAERRAGGAHVGARAGRRARGGAGERECQKRKKSRSFPPDFPAAAPRFGARAGFPARKAGADSRGGGAWNPLLVPGESPARAFPKFC